MTKFCPYSSTRIFYAARENASGSWSCFMARRYPVPIPRNNMMKYKLSSEITLTTLTFLMVLTISTFLMTVTALSIEKFRILSFDVTCFEMLSGILSLYLEAFSYIIFSA